MNRSGFTLMELLAVLILLAIISLIIIPSSLNTVKKAKNGVADKNKIQYINAIKNKIYELELEGIIIIDGTYAILGNGNLCLNLGETNENCTNELDLKLTGSKPIGGSIKIETLNNSKRKISGEIIYE